MSLMEGEPYDLDINFSCDQPEHASNMISLLSTIFSSLSNLTTWRKQEMRGRESSSKRERQILP